MTKMQKVKRKLLIILGLSLSAYLMYSGIEILNHDTTSEVHSDAVK